MILCTSNPAKYAMHREALETLGARLQALPAGVEEIQTLDLEKASFFKAKQAHAILREPVITDDACLLLDAYPGFPGTMTKLLLEAVGMSGLKSLLSTRPLGCELLCCLTVIVDEAESHTVLGRLRGELDFSATTEHPELPLNSVFRPEGRAESLSTLEKTSPSFATHRSKALAALTARLALSGGCWK